MQGIYVNGRRPKSKAAIKRHLAEHGTEGIRLEATSLFGNEYGGPLADAPDGAYHFVGPDPRTSRVFYGTIKVSNDGWDVKLT